MKILKRVVLALVALTVSAVLLVVLFLGPWPTYRESNYRQSRYFQRSITAIDVAAARNTPAAEPLPLMAGWAEREITPEPGHPMAGYGDRPNELRSTGVHEPLFVRALALSNGVNTVVLVGSDMLQTFPNLLEAVETRIAATTPLTNQNIYYTSSHSHGGPGGMAPGLVGEAVMGPYVPEYFTRLADNFAEAIAEATQTMGPARFAHGVVEVPEYIRNRSRDNGPTDAALNFAVVEKMAGGERLYVARYSAHCTVYSEEMLEFNNDYAGAFQRAVNDRTGMPLLFMAGAVGAMRPNPPGPPVPEPRTADQAMGFENAVESAEVQAGRKTVADMLRDQEARVEAMGAALADRLLDAAQNVELQEKVVVAAFAADFSPPPAQVRPLSPKWRLSPLAFRVLGVPTTGRLQAARIGDMILIGMPYDFGGETSVLWRQWATERDRNLWVTGFSGAYLGYLSPDKYHFDLGAGRRYNHTYEIGLMGWFGPNQEAYVSDLFQHAFKRLTNTKEASET